MGFIWGYLTEDLICRVAAYLNKSVELAGKNWAVYVKRRTNSICIKLAAHFCVIRLKELRDKFLGEVPVNIFSVGDFDNQDQ